MRRGADPSPGRRAVRALALAFALLPAAAHAHVVYDRPTLRQQAGEATVIALVEFTSGLSVWSAPDGSDHQEYFAVRLVETLKGAPPPGQFDFFPHAEGEPGFARGDRAIVFLEPTSSRAEFLGLAARFPYFSVQRPGQEWTLAEPGRSEAVELVAEYAVLTRVADAELAPRLRALLLRGLRARDPRLRADALAELVRSRSMPGLLATTSDAAPFVRLVGPGRLAVPERIGLVLLLDGAPGFEADRALGAIAKERLPARDRTMLLRVAAHRDDPALRAYVERCTNDPDASVRQEAQAVLARASTAPASSKEASIP